MMRLSPRSTLFPYTTLFRSERDDPARSNRCAFDIEDVGGKVKLTVTHSELADDAFLDRKSTRLKLQSPMYLVCRLLLENKRHFEVLKASIKAQECGMKEINN